MKLIISGSAEYLNKSKVWEVLEDLNPSIIVVLDAPVGPESLARNWAIQSLDFGKKVTVRYHKTDYNTPREKSVKTMLDNELDANAILLFGCDHGTISLIEHAKKLSFTILNVED